MEIGHRIVEILKVAGSEESLDYFSDSHHDHQLKCAVFGERAQRTMMGKRMEVDLIDLTVQRRAKQVN